MNELRSHWKTNAPDLMRRLERAIAKAGSQRKLALKLGVSSTFINRVYHGLNKPSQKILTELGLTRHVTIKEQR